MENEIEIGVTTITNVIEVTAQPTDQIIDIGVTDNTDEVVINVTPSVIEININKGGLNSNLVTSVNGKIGDVVLDKNDIGLGNVDNTADYDKIISLDTQIALNNKADLVDGVVPSYQLPSYVDDVLEVANYVSLPLAGEIGKIYVTLDNNKMFRWTGSIYIEIASNSAIWGAITGTIGNQTDLQNSLNLRVPYSGATSDVNLGANSLIIGYVGNPNPSNIYVKGTTNNFISVETGGEKTSILSGGIKLNDIQNGGSLKLNLRPAGLNTGIDRIISFPNANGTVALTSDLHNPVTIGTANGLSLATQVLSLQLSSTSTNGALSSTDWNTFNNKANDNAVVHLTGTETIIGSKIFSLSPYLESGSYLKQVDSWSNTTGYSTISGITNGILISASASQSAKLNMTNLTSLKTFEFPNLSGTLALTSDLSSYVPTSRTLTINGVTQDLSANRTFTIPIGISGSGTIGKIPLFTGTTAIGNSSIAEFDGYLGVTKPMNISYSIATTGNALTLGLTNAGSTGNVLYLYNEGTGDLINAQSPAGFVFKINGSGNVGIGTGTIDSKLQVNGGAAIGFSASTTAPTNGLLVNGNVGIGTTSPNETLTLYKADRPYLQFVSATTGTAGTDGTALGFTTSSGEFQIRNKEAQAVTISTSDIERMRISASGAATFTSSVTANGNSIINGTAGADTLYLQKATGASLALSGATGTTNKVILAADNSTNPDFFIYTGGSEKMRITSSGNVGIGTSSPSYKLQISTDSAAKPTTALWTIASDARIKENINKYTKGLNELLKINPITYDYNGLGGFEKGKGGVGIIAQEIAEILPDSVSSIKGKLNETDNEEIDILNFNGHELTYILINAVKELKAEIELLKSKLI